MMTLFNENFYNQLKKLVAEIGKFELGEKLIKIAKEDKWNIIKKIKTKRILKKIQYENETLLDRLYFFYKSYLAIDQPIFYDDKEEEELFKYDPEEIDPVDLAVLLMLSEGMLSEENLFLNWRTYQEALWKCGYRELACFMEKNPISYIYDFIKAY